MAETNKIAFEKGVERFGPPYRRRTKARANEGQGHKGRGGIDDGARGGTGVRIHLYYGLVPFASSAL